MTRVAPRRLADEVALAAVTVAAVVGFARLFDSAAFYPPLLTAALAGHLLAALTRRARTRLAAPVMVVGGAFVCVNVALASATTYGVPTPSTFSALGDALRTAQDSLAQVIAPTAPTTGFILAAAVAIWVGAWAADRLAFRFAAPIEALAPAVTIFLFGTLLAGPDYRMACTALFAVAVLSYVAIQRTVRLDRVRPTLHAGPADRGWATVRLAGAMTVVVVLLGVGTAMAIPTLTSSGLVEVRAGRHDAAPRSVVSPLVDIRSRLIQQSDLTLFTVTANQPAYWRLMALDEFDGTVWSSNQHFNEAGRKLAAEPTASDINLPTTRVSATFDLTGLGGPWAPAPFRAESVTGSHDLLWDAAGATLIVDAKRGDVGGLRYRVESAAPDVTAGQASRALGEIPDQVAQADLALPNDFPAELTTLAERITSGKRTPYEKAKALQAYFRDTDFTYSTDVQPGQDTNAIVSFLERRTGYCEQFAGTYAALGRAVGLPTRVAVGFTQGDLAAGSTDEYVVHGRNAHAWPEVYLAGLGWLPFEPTPGRGNPGSTSYTGIAPQQAAPTGGPDATVPAPTLAPSTSLAATTGPTTSVAAPPTLSPTPPSPSVAAPAKPSRHVSGWLAALLAVVALALGLALGPAAPTATPHPTTSRGHDPRGLGPVGLGGGPGSLVAAPLHAPVLGNRSRRGSPTGRPGRDRKRRREAARRPGQPRGLGPRRGDPIGGRRGRRARAAPQRAGDRRPQPGRTCARPTRPEDAASSVFVTEAVPHAFLLVVEVAAQALAAAAVPVVLPAGPAEPPCAALEPERGDQHDHEPAERHVERRGRTQREDEDHHPQQEERHRTLHAPPGVAPERGVLELAGQHRVALVEVGGDLVEDPLFVFGEWHGHSSVGVRSRALRLAPQVSRGRSRSSTWIVELGPHCWSPRRRTSTPRSPRSPAGAIASVPKRSRMASTASSASNHAASSSVSSRSCLLADAASSADTETPSSRTPPDTSCASSSARAMRPISLGLAEACGIVSERVVVWKVLDRSLIETVRPASPRSCSRRVVASTNRSSSGRSVSSEWWSWGNVSSCPIDLGRWSGTTGRSSMPFASACRWAPAALPTRRVSVGRGTAASAPIVCTPRPVRRSAVAGPTPHMARTGSRCRNAS